MKRYYLCRATTVNFTQIDHETLNSQAAAKRWRDGVLSSHPDAIVTVDEVDDNGDHVINPDDSARA
ncbi:MAG: hypothetical protein V4523_07805 [Pseudomonadota bacterium]